MELSQQTRHNYHQTRMPFRNMGCTKYIDCLTQAAFRDVLDLGCSRCKNMAAAAGSVVSFPVDFSAALKIIVKGPEDDIVSSQEAADILGIKLYKLRRIRKGGNGPAYTWDGRSGTPITYRRGDLEKYKKSGKLEPKEVSTEFAARITGIAVRKLIAMRKKGTGPPWVKSGKCCLYDVAKLKKYKEKCERQ